MYDNAFQNACKFVFFFIFQPVEVVSEEETTDENQEPPNKKVCKESEGTSKKGKLASKGKKSLKVN